MQDRTELIENLVEKTGAYTKASVELFRLKAIAKSADIASTMTTRFAVTVVFTLFFLVFNIGVSIWIGELLKKLYYGFFIVAGFYLLIGIMLLVFGNRWIKTPLHNAIITQALN